MRLPIRLLLITASVAASRAGDAWLAARRARVAERAGRWAAVLANYSAVQRAERAKGADAKYIVAFAEHYGLGNRIAIVTSALALAVASRRALIVLWPRGRMHGRPDYDPAGVVDLFAPTLVDWSTPPDAQRAVRRCAEDVANRPGRKSIKRWAIGDPHDAKTAAALRAFDFSSEEWRPGDRVLCAYGYYYWGWALTCNAALGGSDVLVDYGALQSLLLMPTAAVADRVGRILGRSSCDVGVHLRKADGAEGPSSRAVWNQFSGALRHRRDLVHWLISTQDALGRQAPGCSRPRRDGLRRRGPAVHAHKKADPGIVPRRPLLGPRRRRRGDAVHS